MNLKEIETRLCAFGSGEHADPDVEAARVRRCQMQRDWQTGAEHLAARRRALVALEEADAEMVVSSGKAGDARALTKASDEVRALESSQERQARATAAAARRLAQLQSESAARIESAMRPDFSALVAQSYEHALALVAIQELLELAHHAGNAAMPANSSVLQRGFAGLLSREQVEQWRHNVEAAGLLEVKRQRVA